MWRWGVFLPLSDRAIYTPSNGKFGLAVFRKMMLGRDTEIVLQNEAKSHTTEAKPLPNDMINLSLFSTGFTVFLILGGYTRSPRGMRSLAVCKTGYLSSPSSRHWFWQHGQSLRRLPGASILYVTVLKVTFWQGGTNIPTLLSYVKTRFWSVWNQNCYLQVPCLSTHIAWGSTPTKALFTDV